MAKLKFETAYNQYEEVEILGEGGNGIVYGVKDHSGSEFAIKLLTSPSVTTEKRRRFKNEINFCQKNSHQNILKIIETGALPSKDSKPSKPFYVMPKYGGTLRTLMSIGITPKEALQYMSNILNGVEAAHLQGVFHRDLKPENILWDPRTGSLIVADFGIAHFQEDLLLTHVKTKPNSRLANHTYAAPEQRVPGSSVDHRADIFALGLIFHEMITTIVPHGTGFLKIASKFTDFGYLDEIIDRMIQHDPAKRPADIDRLKKDLTAAGKLEFERQRLSEISRKVVPQFSPDEKFIVDPIVLTGFNIEGSTLVLLLSQKVDREWLDALKDGIRHSDYYYTIDRFNFLGDRASVALNDLNEGTVQRIIDFFKEWLKNVPQTLKHRRGLRAKELERQEQEKLIREREIAQAREVIFTKVKI